MAPAPTKQAVLLKRERAYYTIRWCRVEVSHYVLANGNIVEDVTLECLREIVVNSTTPKRTKPRRP